PSASTFPPTSPAGRCPPRSEWRPAPLRAAPERDAIVRDFDAFLRWIVELRASGRIILTTYRELHAEYPLPPAPWLRADDVLALAGPLAGDGAPLEPRRLAGQWLTPADQLGVLVWTLARHGATGALPAEVPVRRLLGPLDIPEGEGETPAPAAVTLADVLTAAREASETCSAGPAVPG